jgi:hypothetical protein
MTTVPVALAACTDRALSQAGTSCFQASDCAPGLVCVEVAAGRRECSADLSKTEKTRPMGADGGGDASGNVSDGALGADASEPDVVSPPRDASPDTTPDAVADAPAEGG